MLDKKKLMISVLNCLIKDRFYLKKQIKYLKENSDSLLSIKQKIEYSMSLVELRKKSIPDIHFNSQLPIGEKKESISSLLQNNQVIIVAGETGSGKTTQLPKICLSIGLGKYGLIGHTQPRRIAARSVAGRIASELNVELGEQVGYQVRFEDKSKNSTLIKLMTDGVLLSEIQSDRFLTNYEVIIIDEAHERSLNIDFLLGYLKFLLPKRPDLKIIVTSATIDVNKFSHHFNQAPIIEVSGRSFPVSTQYLPLDFLFTDPKNDQLMHQGILHALGEIESLESKKLYSRLGDVLVFFSGESEIIEAANFLRKANLRHTEILPLYSRLPNKEQQKIFCLSSSRRVILSTNVAETSLTVPGIQYVIDTGTARISRYSIRAKVQRLPVEPISQASANQRQGRCGRMGPGVCFRLYSEEDFLSRAEFTCAEIGRTNLASVILNMLSLGLGNIDLFPFIDPPEKKAINDGFLLLQELEGVDSDRRLTHIGRKMSKIPLDPKFSKTIVTADQKKTLSEILIILSALSIQDPRERPVDKQQAADEVHRALYDKNSDFMTFLNLWNCFEEQRQGLSQNQLRKYCKQEYLSYTRMKEWCELHRQLIFSCKTLGFTLNNAEEANYDMIHQSLLSGMLSYIGQKDEFNYKGARNKIFYIFPTSALHKKKPKWIMGSELVETSRLYARLVAKINPEWIEPLAQHLLKHQYFEPHWEKKRGQVIAFEQVSLYGLVIIPRRKIDYGKIDLVESRSIFIRSALVEREYDSKSKFWQKNNQLLAEIDQLENKTRRRDILVDIETIYDFYDKRLPKDICNSISFEKWVKILDKNDDTLLCFSKQNLINSLENDAIENQFPDMLIFQRDVFPLSYCFDPSLEDDGVNVTIPLAALYKLPRYQIEWLVPGFLYDKCVALIRTLPKAVRKSFVPVPYFVKALLERMYVEDRSLTNTISYHLYKMTGIKVKESDWDIKKLSKHFFMNIKVVDEQGKILASSRSLMELKEQFVITNNKIKNTYTESTKETTKQWNFETLPQKRKQSIHGIDIEHYVALVDHKKGVSIEMFENESWANYQHRFGVARLIMYCQNLDLDHVIQSMKNIEKIKLLASIWMKPFSLVTEIKFFLILEVFLNSFKSIPRDRHSFEMLIHHKKADLVVLAKKTDELLIKIFAQGQKISKKIKGNINFEQAFVYSDIKAQLNRLFETSFLCKAGTKWLRHYPRFMNAIEHRLEKFPQQIEKNRIMTEELINLYQQYETRDSHFAHHKQYDEQLLHYRWILEEYRVSLFAQHLGTEFSVSEKRLKQFWEKLKNI